MLFFFITEKWVQTSVLLEKCKTCFSICLIKILRPDSWHPDWNKILTPQWCWQHKILLLLYWRLNIWVTVILMGSYYSRNVYFLVWVKQFCLKMEKNPTTTKTELLLTVVNRMKDSVVVFNRGTGKLQEHFRGNGLIKFSLCVSYCTYFVNLTTVPFKHSSPYTGSFTKWIKT